MTGWVFAHAQDDVNPHILRILGSTFSLDTANMQKAKALVRLRFYAICSNYSLMIRLYNDCTNLLAKIECSV